VTIRKGISGGKTIVNGARSSQYLSALLMIAPYAERGVELEVAGDLVAEPYVDMTIAVMRQFGVEVERDGYRGFRVEAGRVSAQQREVEPDAQRTTFCRADARTCASTVSARARAGRQTSPGAGAWVRR
jgi:3-phosphoshikimate 1-carboxyvinyltransferase